MKYITMGCSINFAKLFVPQRWITDTHQLRLTRTWTRWPLELQWNHHIDFTITEKAPPRSFSQLQGITSAFTFKTLLSLYMASRHGIGMPMEKQAALRHYANLHVYLHWVNTCLAQCLKCESDSRCFQPGKGRSKGLLRDCDIFVNLRLTFV